MTKKLVGVGYKAVVMPFEVSARGFIGPYVNYDPFTKLSICGNKRRKALKVTGGSEVGKMRGSFIRIKNAVTIARLVGEII